MVPQASAESLLAAWDEHRQIEPLSARVPGFGLESAYRLTAEIRKLREARGERVIGRKIGFTNRTIWQEYKVYAPIWGYMYDTTVHNLADAKGRSPLNRAFEPRIEPEIAFHFMRQPNAEMDEAALLGCIDWVAHGFEIVQTLYPGWVFSAADTVAGFGLHGSYFMSERRAVTADRQSWLEALSRFEIELSCDGVLKDKGHARNVLGGPLSALRELVKLLQADEANPPLAAGEIVTTGTLTRALPISPGETWSTRLEGLNLKGLEIAFTE